jgi:hypothetical protein
MRVEYLQDKNHEISFLKAREVKEKDKAQQQTT